MLKLSVFVSSVEDFKNALIQDFGSLNVASNIRSDRLLSGPHGIDGMIEKIFYPLIDDLPLEHPLYTNLYGLLQTFAAALAQKLSNHKKVCLLFHVS